jgi:hypothetical protein
MSALPPEADIRTQPRDVRFSAKSGHSQIIDFAPQVGGFGLRELRLGRNLFPNY